MPQDQERSMEARVGRDNQRYGSQGERLVAGVVPLSSDRKSVLMIQSVRRNAWVLPKGGWETDEPTAEHAACREAWEEAGVVCKIKSDLGHIPERRRPEQLTETAPKAAYHFFEAAVEKEEAEWPEKHKRNRKWMGYKEAIVLLKDRPELSEALNRSSIDKTC
ncbi:nudix/MutT family protein [Delphinella strobiligena]|nr:nudix/MutT family protein [Delphinella strobiligena]